MYDCDALFSTCDSTPRGKKTDYMQLGWLVAYILDQSNQDEHEREWDTQPDAIKDNIAVKSLIKGCYKTELLDSLPSDTSSIEQVLEKRLQL